MAATILIVDDQESIRTMVFDALTHLKHSPQTASSLQEARAALKEQTISLVLSDIDLGEGETGIDLLQELAPRSPDIAVVMMTGNTDIQTAIDCLRVGAFDYLLKPFNLQELDRVVRRVLQRQRKMIDERERVAQELFALGKFPSENPNPVLRVENSGKILFANAACGPLLKEWGREIGQEVPPFLRELISGAWGEGRRQDIEVEAAGRIFSFAVTPIKEAHYVYLYGHDITRLKETERELIRVKDQATELSLHDTLTGLPNRALLEDRLDQEIAHSLRNKRPLGVVFVDLDHFKTINDTHGHKMGDQVLIAVARLLRDTLRKTDTVARWGGDELILLLPDLHGPEEAMLVCDRLKKIVSKKIHAELNLFITLSMGIAVFPVDAQNAAELLQMADTALYGAKAAGRNQAVLYSCTQALPHIQQRARLRVALSQAIANRQMQAHYQPIIEASSGQITGMEALARWHDRELGWVSPGVFVPVAEEIGLINELGAQVLSQAMRFAVECQKRGLTLSLSINISIRQLLNPQFIPQLMEHVKGRLQPGSIIIEMTESQALLGLAAESRAIQEMAGHGFKLSIDDFGQGYSSLSSLLEMPVHELKIDMKFVRRLSDPRGARVASAIIEMARALGLETVAEGVEDKAAMGILRDMGVNRLQGFYFSKPLPPEEFLGFVKTHHGKAF